MEDTSTTIAGYSLVRLIRRDSVREVWVATSEGGAGVELHVSTQDGVDVLAREFEALISAAHPHIVPLLDSACETSVVLVRQLLGRDLAGWLIERGAPEVGEAVTALAPIASAIAALHEVGAVAGRLALHTVRLDADGAPLVLAEGATIETESPTPAWLETSAGVREDVGAWRSIAETVLGAAGVALPEAAAAALRARDLGAAGRALLDEWPALPLALHESERMTQTVEASRRQRVRERSGPRILEPVARLLDRLIALRGSRPGGAEAVRGALSLGIDAVRRVRPKFWAVAGCGAAALALAGGLAAAAGEPAAAPRSGTSAVVTPPSEEVSSPTDGAAQASPSVSADREAAAVEPSEATLALLRQREACIADDDAACLATLHSPESPLLAASRPWRMAGDASVGEVQRFGEVWLVQIESETAPASVLVVSTEAGLVLRDAWEREA